MPTASKTASRSSGAVIRTDTAGIATLRLNHPEQFNALSREMITTLSAHLDDIAAADDIRVVVIESTGKAFSSGHNLKEMRANHSEAFYRAMLADCAATMQKIVHLPQPVIAKVQGIATAAGCQLVASCDLALASSAATFATSGINYGLFCATPAVAVSRVVPRKAALELLFTGDSITAETAADIGLVNRVVAPTELDAEVDELARKIAAKSPQAIKIGKASFYEQINRPLDEAYRCASAEFTKNLLSDDGLEGLNAFVEKRRPNWAPP